MSSPAGEPRTYPQGVTCWVDTEQPDVDAAAAFYAELFGWTFDEVTPPGSETRYLVAKLDGRDAAAIGTGPQARWHTFVAVDDADMVSARVTELGGSVTEGPVDAGPGGRTSTVTDPQGTLFHLWQARRRLGAQALNEPGAWNFSDLHTTDPDAAQAFYTALFGWRFVDQGYGVAIQVPGYGDHLEATVDPDIRTRQAHAPDGFEDVIGSLVSPPGGDPDHERGWRVTFTVADRDAAVGTAQRLGATILATDDTAWTRTARVRDPQGAVLTLSQFTPPEGF